MRRLFSALTLALALAACGAHDSADSPPPPERVGARSAAVLAQDDTICSEAGLKVYYQPAVPGGAAQCYCALRVGHDTGASPETSTLLVYRQTGATYVVSNVQQGTGSGKWNTSWAAASCP